MKVLLVAVLVNAFHAAFENGEKAFDGIGMNRAIRQSDVLFGLVIDGLVTGEVDMRDGVLTGFVGQQARFVRDIRQQNRPKRFPLKVVDNHAARLAAGPVHERKHLVLVRSAAATPALAAVGADKGLVHFDRSAALAKRSKTASPHSLTDAVRHKPCALKRHAKRAVQLVRANAFLAGRDQEDRLQPQAQRNVARLEDRPDLDRKRLAAVVALVGTDPRRLAGHRPVALDAAAMRAYRTFRPDAGFDEAISGCFVVEMRGGKNGLAHVVSPYVRPV